MTLLRPSPSVIRRNARPVVRHRLAKVSLIASVVVAVVAAACTDISTSPTTPVALAFDTLPSPSIVYGDTLRDIDGVARKLTGKAYNSDGNEIVGADIEYYLTRGDTTGSIDNQSEFLIATTDTLQTQIEVRAQINGIPSQSFRILQIVRMPDSLDRGEGVLLTRVDTLNYSGADPVATLATNLQVRVLRHPSPDTAPRLIRAWPVRFQVMKPAGADSLLVNENGVPSTLDTTSDQGIAFRKIRIRRQPDLSTGVPDTVIVEATARNKDGLLRGAPIRFTVVTRKTS